MKLPLFFSRFFKAKVRDAGWFAIGLTEHGVYLAQVSLSGARPCVLRCEYHETGEVTATVLEKLKREAHLDNQLFTTLLAVGDYQLLMVEAPNVPVNELKTAIRWKIKDSLNYHVDDATVDVLEIPDSKYGSERTHSIYAVAAANVTIQKKYVSLFEKAKIELNVIDIPETAQRNIAALFEEADHAIALLAFDDNGGLLTITANGELYLARRLEMTVGQLQDANENLSIQHRDRVELELRRSLDYFDRQYHQLPISRVLVSVPASIGLVAFLSDEMDVVIEQLDLTRVMDIRAAPALADSEFVTHVLPTLGAALREEKRTL